MINVAGPRASEDPGVYEGTRNILALVREGLFPRKAE
jgi:hypothetical protein